MTTDIVRDHYQAAIGDRDALLARLATALDALGTPIDARALAPLDQFHMGGLVATRVLAECAGVFRGVQVLDAGAGLGGPARHLAATYGAQVTGVDLSPDYVAIATLLTERAGLVDHASFRTADLLDLPFEDGRFELVWTQHVAMNIANRSALYRELRRVLKPSGKLAFFDPAAADGRTDLHYPVPWAETKATSTLLTLGETQAAVAGAGFSVELLEDVTQETMGWAAQTGEPPAPGGLNLSLIVGARMPELAANFACNLRDGRVRSALGVARAI